MLYADQKTYLVELLMKQDQMSMACSIESRVPFLDHPFVEFSTRLPDSLKIGAASEQKYIIKKAVEDLLPHSIIYRKKMGFPTPLRQWLLDPRAEPLFSALLHATGSWPSIWISRNRRSWSIVTGRARKMPPTGCGGCSICSCGAICFCADTRRTLGRVVAGPGLA